MICEMCKQDDNRVINTKNKMDGVERRRRCTGCGNRFATFETYTRKKIWIPVDHVTEEERKRLALYARSLKTINTITKSVLIDKK